MTKILTTKTLLTLCTILAFALPLHAQEIRKTLHVGQSEVYGYDRMTTAAVGSPAVADIVPLSAHQLLVNAKNLGETTLFVCDHAGTHRLRLVVVPLPPLSFGPVAAQVQAAIGLPGVTARAVGDTLFLEGVVPNTLAWQRAAAIAGVYDPKVKNLLTVTPEPAPASLAQTYAALLSPSLAPLGIVCTVVGDKTLALSGRYAGRARTTAKLGANADDAPDPEIAPKSAAWTPTKSPAADSPAPDPVDRLMQSLPSDLKVVSLLNLGAGPTRQILVHAKIIEMGCKVSAE